MISPPEALRPVWAPHIWWGNAASVERLAHWQQRRKEEGLPLITHVCNTAANAVHVPLEERVDGVEYLDLEMLDAPNMLPTGEYWHINKPQLEKALSFVEDAFAKGGIVLVNCQMGQNRSGAVLLAWMLTHKCTKTEKPLDFTVPGAQEYLRFIKPGALNNNSLVDLALEVAKYHKNGNPIVHTMTKSWVVNLPDAPVKEKVETVEEEEDGDVGCLMDLVDGF
eukprot:TRINITY_DN8482_c0_g2_i2.p2 TRINITY_DN8482_c0_g2~~TRINITY_DN8482_c0_g2_i2.p2  ORF type:complete len:223 (-),score=44.58 TRINITY_DN8482_c0_g2_i2:177-845(-)